MGVFLCRQIVYAHNFIVHRFEIMNYFSKGWALVEFRRCDSSNGGHLEEEDEEKLTSEKCLNFFFMVLHLVSLFIVIKI